MASLQELHQQSYSDMPFDDFAARYHQKFYSDMPFESFMQKAGGAAPQQASAERKSSILGDVAKSAAAGLGEGAIGATYGLADIPKLAEYGVSWTAAKAAEKLGLLPQGKTANDLIADAQKTFGGPDFLALKIQKGVEQNITGEFHKPETKAGEYARTIGSFLPAAAMGGNGARGLLSFGVIPGAASETAGQLTKGTEAEPWARFAGGIGGAMVGPSIVNAPGRVMSPMTIQPERAQQLAVLQREGVPVTAGQATGSRPLQWAESVLGDTPGAGGRAAAMQTAQNEAFTQAALKRAGIDADRAMPDVMKAGRDRIGKQFDDLAARNTLAMDQQFATDIGDVVTKYVGLVPPSQRAPAFGKYIDDLINTSATGAMIEGPAYNSMRSRLGKMAESVRMSDPPAADAFRGIRKALDGAMERSISPQDQAAWSQARREYGNYKALEKAAGAAGANAAEGMISPAQIRSAIATGNKRGSYVRGEGDLAELARAGVNVMSPLPQSGTSPRATMQALLSGGGALAGGPMGLAAGLAGPAVAGRALLSNPVQQYLQNQAAQRLGLIQELTGDQRARGLLSSMGGAMIANGR